MLLYPSRASPQKLDPKALGPFIGSWIGVDCPLDSGDLWAYRIELYGEQENPYFMLREIGSLEDSARLRKNHEGNIQAGRGYGYVHIHHSSQAAQRHLDI